MLSILQTQMGYVAPVSALRTPATTVAPRMAVQDMPGTGPETLNKVFDPLKFSEYGSDKTLAWCRARLTRQLPCGLATPWGGLGSARRAASGIEDLPPCPRGLREDR